MSATRLAMVDSSKRERGEPTIALINIVFLMLIFFLIAGTLAPPLDGDVTLVDTRDLQGREPPDALVVHADGSLTYRQNATSLAAYLAHAVDDAAEGAVAVRVVPDRALPAHELLQVASDLRRGGADQVFIVTERTPR